MEAIEVTRRIFATDHKTVARQYFFLSLFAVLIGSCLSLLMRFHLTYPAVAVGFFGKIWPTGAPGGVITPELYLSLLTLHGTIMVFFVLTLAPVNAFGNLILPGQLGATEMAYPRLNALSFWITVVSFILLLCSFLASGGGPLSGWTAYPPLSAVGAIAGPGQGTGQTLWFVSIAVFCLGSILTAINFIVTVLDMRAPGMTLMRMPLTCWSWFVTGILSLLSFSVLLPAGMLILLDRLAGTSFFIPGGLLVADLKIDHDGGSPLLWQHFFWFFGHPEVYIAILPGMGIVSHLLATFARRPIFGYKAMVCSTVAIAFLGLLVWGHHMFISGLNPYSVIAFSLLTMVIGAPSAVKTLNWIATLWNGKSALRLTTPMLFSIGFVSIFVTGGLSGLVLGQPQLDAYFHDTYFVVAHFHLIMGIAALFAIFAATHFWFPLLFGRLMSDRLGKWHFYLTFIGAYALFLPMHFAGFLGNPRRYSDFTSFEFLKAVLPLQKAITHAAFFTAAVQLIFVYNLFRSLRWGERAPVNPWESTSLEWFEPPTIVHRGPYEFGQTKAGPDFRPQNEAD